MLIFFLYFCMFFSCYTFLSVKSNLLLVVISFEFIVLVVYWFLIILISFFSVDFFLSLYFLSFTVCDSAVALTLLVRVVRYHGGSSISLISNIF